jgi:hypothetical protein
MCMSKQSGRTVLGFEKCNTYLSPRILMNFNSHASGVACH